MTRALLKGAFTALVTPMTADYRVDYEGFRFLVNFQFEAGIDGIVPLGTTGETPTLEPEEREKLTRIAVEEARGRGPVIIGTGANATKQTVENTRRARDAGADAALVVTPYYNKPNDGGLVRHFEEVADKGGLPVVVYNVPSRTGRNISAALTERLAAIPQVIGIKESSGDIGQIGDIIAYTGGRGEEAPFAVLSGDDGLALPVLALGGQGVVSVVSNLAPAQVAALVRAGLTGDMEECRRLHYALLPFMKAAFVETNPVPIKAAMALSGLPAGPTRLPLGPLSPANAALLKAAAASAASVAPAARRS
ncbi:MAG: 4-hydroxy-tetrahydrodipicolinate synthase [Spirochaetaceae bacterium]|jgi:4-hydroxy-tetrahydrodipicolinate synthase|nr:4-hydroxy-tetrahydrodipicolinate synthase [Spirochaetaceae bacterium]